MLKSKGQVWLCTPVIPVIQEVGESVLSKCMRPCLKNKLKAKGLGYSSSGRVFAKHKALSPRPSTATKKKKEKKKLKYKS
jgi:hypothetical protein